MLLLLEQGTGPGIVMAVPKVEDEVLHPEPNERKWCCPLLLGAV